MVPLVDEAMIEYNGWLHWKQYMPMKPIEWRIKLWVLCDAPTGYCLALDVYTGCKDRLAYNMGRTYNITMMLAIGYLLHNHLLYADNFYSSLLLIREESEDEIRVDRCTSPSGKMKQTASANQLTLIMCYPTLLPVRFPRSTPSRVIISFC